MSRLCKKKMFEKKKSSRKWNVAKFSVERDKWIKKCNKGNVKLGARGW